MGIRVFRYEASSAYYRVLINATRPVMTLVGAMLIFGERLNLYQWIGVFMAVISFSC